MKSNTRYLIDANVFIQAKNFHYRFEFCQAFALIPTLPRL
ncbi:MAG: DUF4411 family protein [Methylococcales bacterium]